MNNMEIWNKLKTPPQTALKPIEAGRLKGMTDINPQWRLQALTEQFGACGIGWRYSIVRMWSEQVGEETVCFTEINLFYKIDDKWSEAVPGTGGSKLGAMEKKGLHVSDEGYKMSLTDAISVAAKAIGLAADIYLGKSDSKYQRQQTTTEESKVEGQKKKNFLSPASLEKAVDLINAIGLETTQIMRECSLFVNKEGKEIYVTSLDSPNLSQKWLDGIIKNMEKMKAKKGNKPPFDNEIEDDEIPF